MKNIKIKNIILALVAIVSSGIGTLGVNAAVQKQSMHVSPPNQRVILAPGEKYSNTIIVSNANDSTRALKYELAIGSFSENGGEDGKDDYGNIDHISVSSYNQIMDWITLDRTGGTIEPNQKDVITYTIDVPDNAPAGGQYATIIVKDVTGRDDQNNGNMTIQSTFQFASIIYAEIAGTTNKEGSILENSVPGFNFSKPFTVSSMVENRGNVHTDAEYTLEIWPLFSDEEIYTNIEDPKTSLILPDTMRHNVQTWNDAPLVGIFKVKQTIKIYDDVSIVEKTVIICPLWLVFIIVFAIALLVIWIISRVRARKK